MTIFLVYSTEQQKFCRKNNVISTSHKIYNKPFLGGYVKARIVELNNDYHIILIHLRRLTMLYNILVC